MHVCPPTPPSCMLSLSHPRPMLLRVAMAHRRKKNDLVARSCSQPQDQTDLPSQRVGVG